MKKEIRNSIFSALIGGTFFAIPYLGLNLSLLPSIGIAVAAYGAGNLIFSDNKNSIEEMNKILENRNASIEEKLKVAKYDSDQLYNIMKNLEDNELVEDVTQIRDTSIKIINTVEKEHKKYDKVRTFFEYYLPVTLKILKNYDEIENQKLDSDESKEMMQNTKNIVKKIKASFKKELSNLYQSNIIDTDAEIKVFDAMLSQKGFGGLKIEKNKKD